MKRENRAMHRDEGRVLEKIPGLKMIPLAWDTTMMVCHVTIARGTVVPMHRHVQTQSGYVVSGTVRFTSDDGSTLDAVAGTGYVMSSMEGHAAEALEDSVLIETFSPFRPEFIEDA